MKGNPLILFLFSFLFTFVPACRSKRSSSERGEKKVLVIAHRGGAALAPENTLAAFRNAIRLGVDMIEIDVHQTRDGHVVVIHDNSVDRTTDGHGRVGEMTLAEIRRLDAGSKFDKRFAGERVPTLEETLNTLQGKAALLLEIKKDHDTLYPGLEEKVVKILQDHDAVSRTVVQSFNLHTVRKVQALDPSIRTFYLLGRNFPRSYDSLAAGLRHGASSPSFAGWAPHHSVLDRGKVDTLHRAGYLVYTWTVDEADEIRRMVQAGVDGIITNHPDRLLTVLKEEKKDP